MHWPTQPRDFQMGGRSPVLATSGMAASSMPAATLTAIDVLRAGGNAMDAAVAAAAVLAVIEPQSTGIGGDVFCLYAPANQGKVIALNGSGGAPAAATPERLAALGYHEPNPYSPHSVTIPGAVSAWETLLAAHGTRGLDELLRPAIGFAEQGWPVSPRVAHDWALGAVKLRAAGALHFLPNDQAPGIGDRFTQPALARTLRRIAREGARGFYEGPVAADIVGTLRARGGLHTEADFAAARTAAEFVTPIRLGWRGHEVWQCPPNGSGLLVLMILGILDGIPSAPDGPLSALRLHRHIEAARFAYRDRDAFLADPAQIEVPVARLTSPEYLAALRASIDDDHAMAEMPLPGEALLPPHRDTVYLSVVDRDGNACSFINSIFESFGSMIHAAESGVLLHNRGFSFRLEPGHPNSIAPGKRPMHTIIPGMLTKDGQAVMPYGVMGGHFQPMGQSLFLTNLLEYGLDLQQALDLPRLMPRLGEVQIERGIPQAARDGLVRRGHRLVVNDLPHGGGQAIWIDRARGCLVGASDGRKDGLALGY
jgi:gamma-glutamyltranspeptidase/glutathione hydrolase